MTELLHPQVLWPIVIGVVIVVSVLADQWRKVRQREIDANLKMEMVRQGMSADDIERVMSAGSKKRQEAAAAEED